MFAVNRLVKHHLAVRLPSFSAARHYSSIFPSWVEETRSNLMHMDAKELLEQCSSNSSSDEMPLSRKEDMIRSILLSQYSSKLYEQRKNMFTDLETSFPGPVLPMRTTASGNEAPQIDLNWVGDLSKYMTTLKPLPKEYIMHILHLSLLQHYSYDNVIEVKLKGDEDQLTIAGDTHGQYFDLMNIFSDTVASFPSTANPFLFNGDFVDRGRYSFEVAFLLIALKIANGNCIHLLRGNHETTSMNSRYGFEAQVLAVYDHEVLALMRTVFASMPLAAVVEDKIFVTHGGIGKLSVNMTIDDLNEIDRHTEPDFGSSAAAELLWSDPIDSEQHTNISLNFKRGGGYLFGKNATATFLNNNDLDLMVRSHELRQEGFSVHHEGKCVTVFSAPNYVDQCKNLGALLRVSKKADSIEESNDSGTDGEESKEKEQLYLSILQFAAVKHPYSPVPKQA